MTDVSRIEAFEKEIKELDYFVMAPISHIYDALEDPKSYEIVECLRALILNNSKIIYEMQEQLNSLRSLKAQAKDIIPDEKTPDNITQRTISRDEETPDYNLNELIDSLMFGDYNEQLNSKISNLSPPDKVRLKLHFLKKVIEIKQQIRRSIVINPIKDIKDLQSELNKVEYIIELINSLSQEKEQAQIEDLRAKYKIIFIPNGKKGTYFLDDVLQFLDSKNIIKKMVDKIIDGYFLQTKDIKAIEKASSCNLYEYKHPSGARILFVIDGGVLCICSLFFKDKQKSTKIDNYYAEAENRYLNNKDYILKNLNHPDFYIEQDVLIGNILHTLDGTSYIKTLGDGHE